MASESNMIRFGPKNEDEIMRDPTILSVSVISDGVMGHEQLLFQLGFTNKLLNAEETKQFIMWLSEKVVPDDLQRTLRKLFFNE